MYLKKSVGRTVVDHPTRIISFMIRRELEKLGVLGDNATPEAARASLQNDADLGELYENHPVYSVLSMKDSVENIEFLFQCISMGSNTLRTRVSWGSMSRTFARASSVLCGSYAPLLQTKVLI